MFRRVPEACGPQRSSPPPPLTPLPRQRDCSSYVANAVAELTNADADRNRDCGEFVPGGRV
eukprot:3575868-Alexandrium_andersonii.AAC.1